MSNNSLHISDEPGDHAAPGYSAEVAEQLHAAYSLIGQASKQALTYRRAFDLVQPSLKAPMSYKQRLKLLYILSLAGIAMDTYDSTFEHLGNALDLAVILQDAPACAELAYLHGIASGQVFRYREAVAYQHFSLDTLHTMHQRTSHPDPSFELDILLDLAGGEFSLGHYHATERHLQAARQLFTLVSLPPLQAAAIEWLQAFLDRWRGQSENALRHALAAADVYLTAGSPTAASHIQSQVADMALDLAETFSAGSPNHARTAFLTLAQPYAARAVRLARRDGSVNAMSVVALTEARWQRLAGHNVNRVAAIEAVIHHAEASRDDVLLARAWTSLGDELTALDSTEAGLNCYRYALQSLANSEVRSWSKWPLRALLHASEMRAD